MTNMEFLKEAAFDAGQFAEERNYWLDKLAGSLEKTLFPYDYNRGEQAARRVGTVTCRLPADLCAKLIKAVNESDSRLHMILAAGLVTLLDKYTGKRDIILGCPIEKQETDGVYINTALALRIPIADNMTFKELILRVRSTIIDANNHLNYPVERLPYELNIPGPGPDFPLFDIAILLENIHDKKYLEHLNLNMIFSFHRGGENIEGTVEYNASLYEKVTVERILSHFIYLLAQALINVDALCAGISILSKEEKKRLIADFNDTPSNYPRDKTIHELFQRQAVKTPGHTAVVYENQQVTYNELDKGANRLAHRLRAVGVETGTIAAVMGKRTIEIITALLAVLKAGGIYLPLNAADPAGRLRFILADSRAFIVLTQEHAAEEKKELLKSFSPNHIITIDDRNRTVGPGKVNHPALPGRPRDAAYIIYTSGTTGKPKGVVVEHRALVNYTWWAAETYVKNQPLNFPLYTSISFDMTVTSIFTPLITGNAIVIYGGERYDFLIDRVIDENRVDVVKLTPSHLKMIREKKPAGKVSSIKCFILGGEELETQWAREAHENFNGKIEIYNEYGPTETTVGSMIYRFNPQKDRGKSLPIGTPAANSRVYIMDGGGGLLPAGSEGEIHISGHGVARGYLNRPELSKEKFLPDPFFKGEKMYRSGDLARRITDDPANIDFLGRLDQQVKIRGFRIELGEIDNRLLHHEEIRDAATILREDEPGEKHLCSYIVSDRELPVSELREYLAKKLPDYMVPVFFVNVERIPLNSNGKLDRNALPRPGVKAGEEYVAPRNEVEEKLLKTWLEILALEPGDIGIDANFFELGGHSLNATVLAAKIHRQFNIKIALVDIFRMPTIRGLAEYMTGAVEERFVTIEPVPAKAYYPLSSAQKRLYILQQMGPENIAYNIPAAFELEGDVSPGKFRETFKQLIKRHESFRTSFALIEGQPVQRIHQAVEFEMEYFDLTAKTREGTRRETTIANFVQVFDLSRAPLLRVRLTQVDKNRCILMVDMHHIISDAISMNIISKEFMGLYGGEEPKPLRIQYKDFSQWQNHQKEKEEIKKQEAYWLKEFEDGIAVVDLPTDYARPPVQSFEGSILYFEIGAEETGGLKQLALREDVTLYMVLLSLFNILLARLSGREDIVVGTPVAGRRHADLDHIIGIFVNTLVVRNYPAGEKTYKAFLKETGEKTLEVFENQDYPFEDLVQRVAFNRDMSRNPLFDIEFMLENTGISELVIPGLKLKPHVLENKTAKFDLSLQGMEVGEKVIFSFDYCTRLFKKETIERFTIYFKRIISSVLGDPGKKISQIEILTKEEKNRLLIDFNNTTAAYPGSKTLHELFAEQAGKTPDHIAVTVPGRPRPAITYRKLNETANRLARRLENLGVQPDTIVGIMMERSMEMITGLLGILKSGGAYLPIDPDYPEARKRFMFENSEAKILLTHKYLMEGKPGVFAGIVPADIIPIDDQNISMGDASAPVNKNKPMDLAYLIYTSGTTGKPKGVMIEHRGVVNYICWAVEQYVKNERVNFPLYTSISFDLTVTSIFTPLLSGNAVVVYRGDNKEFLIEKIIEEDRVGIIKLTPSHLKMIRNKIVGGVSNIKAFIVGGEELETTLARDISREFNGDIGIYNEYGPTEAAVGCMIYKFDLENDNGKSVPIGIPAANTQVYILDKRRAPVPIGVPGELYIGGDGLARGYWKNGPSTAEKFTAHPFIEGARLYRSGDLARMLPGENIEFLGRIDNQVKVRGFRVEPGEIEHRLLEHPGIKNAVVTAKSDDKGDNYLYAYIVPADTGADTDEPLNASQLRAYLMKDLPAYMIPSYFIPIPGLPLTAHGKLDKTALDAYGTKGTTLGTAAEYVAPANKLEKIIAGTWQEVLKMDRMGVYDNFFDIGGTSMDIILVINKLKEILQRDIPVTTMYEYPTIGSFSRFMSGQKSDDNFFQDELNTAKTRMNKTFRSLKGRSEELI